MFRRLNILTILIAVIFLLTTAFGSSLAIAAESDPNEPGRGAFWNQTQYYTDAWGRTVTVGQFGPDLGMGEQGSFYESRDPVTGAYTSYYSAGMGVGAGGPGAGYWGMFSPAAGASYGPYAGGGTPQVQSTPGYDTQGYYYSDLWGSNTNFFQAQPNPMAQLIFGLMGYGGGGYSGYGGGYGGYGGGYGGYTGGYGASAYGGFGPSLFGGFFGGGFSPFGSFGGFGGFGGGGYPTRIY